MAVQPLNTLKAWFETGDKPTQSQFWDWLDSFFHKGDSIPQSQVSGLDVALAGLATVESVAALKAITLNNVTLSSVSQNIPAGTIIHKIRVKSTSALAYNLGTSAGGGQIVQGQTVDANTVDIVTVDFDVENLTTIHFSGLAGTTTIKIYLLQ